MAALAGVRRGHPAVPWVLGVVAALVVLGPALAPGHLLNLDLVTTPRLRFPDWRWGAGPGTPHRVPLYVLLSVCSSAVGGAVVIKTVFVVTLMVLFVGVWRLAATGDARIDAGVALLVTWSPFTITRLAIGHLSVVWAMAAIAWSAPALLRLDGRAAVSLRRAAGLAALGGLVPGSWVLAVGAAGVVGGPRTEFRTRLVRWLRLVPLQLVWIVPSALFAVAVPRLVGSAGFRPDIGILAPLELLGGLGFWRTPSQVPGAPWWPLVALGLGALTVSGIRSTVERFGRPWVVAAGGAALAPVVAVVPGLSDLVDGLTGSAVGAPLREMQRWWGVALVLLAPCWAHGAAAWRDRAAASALPTVLPAASALLLAGNGLWGAGGVLVPVDYPPGWATVAERLRDDPGTTLVLPWHQYLDIPFADGRRLLNPLPEYLPGDVVFSTDPELAVAQAEIDPRGPVAIEALDEPASAARVLGDLGIRYVAIAHVDVDDDATQLLGLPGTTVVHTDDDVSLVRVDRVTARPVDWWVGAIGRLPAGDGPAAVVGGPGWLLGTERVDGAGPTLDPGRGNGVLWYWPALLVIAADGVFAGWVAGELVRAVRRRGSASTMAPT